jgi:single-strand DNA-binding protein
MSLNKVILIGNVGKDPEIRHLDTGIAVANFPLATSETYVAKNGEKVTTTEWHNIVVWRGLAEVAEKYVTKGKQIFIEGRIRTRNYDDKDGNKRYITEIYADSMQLLGRKEDSPSGQQNSYQSQGYSKTEVSSEPEAMQPPIEDDLPF